MSELGPIIQALTRPGGREEPAFAFDPVSGGAAQSLNAAFLILLQGPSHPDHARAGEYLEAARGSPDWDEAACFYLEGTAHIAEEIAEARRDDPGFAHRLESLTVWAADPRNLTDGRKAAEAFWAVFFPEALGILSDRTGRLQALRARRRVSIDRPNPSPLADPARELLFTANALLTAPSEASDRGSPGIDEDLMRAARAAGREPQLFWYDHPIPLGGRPENNEILHGLGGLEEAFRFERERGRIDPGERPVCLLSVSVTHAGLHHLARRYIREEIGRRGGLSSLDLFAFTETDTRRIVADVLAPARARYLSSPPAEKELGVFGVDGEYGRHYSFLKAVAAFWSVLVDSRVRATFKIDLDQVFPEQELVAETGRSAFEHFLTPLWGALGRDALGRPVELGMIAGALVNACDIAGSLYTPDVPFPDRDPSYDEFVFCGAMPQALSTEAEMMARYGRGGPDGQEACLERVHVTGGTNGILVDSLRRHRPFTPSFVGRAEDQAYILSALGGDGPRLAYLHQDGLVMRHDKDVFAREAVAAARLGKLIGDYVRILYFSAYARVVAKDVRELKDRIDPFTGCFVSAIPATVVHLRFALKAASLFAAGDDADGDRFVREGASRIRKALAFACGEDSALRRTYLAERAGWDLFYATLAALEGALSREDPFARGLRERARAIVENCRIPTERRD
ncbi:MAG TPA: hypothetical protein ENO03_01130 [Candidatus Aminicenantes bacterium]|nr:hypothetical protein [Candidatus Aminicenantes bacterium]HDT12937.1 hypothetical protein [Candidatus Aminicenantes bacterium]